MKFAKSVPSNKCFDKCPWICYIRSMENSNKWHVVVKASNGKCIGGIPTKSRDEAIRSALNFFADLKHHVGCEGISSISVNGVEFKPEQVFGEKP